MKFSKWFVAVLALGVILYGSLWFYTIRLSNVQAARHETVVLPSAPKDAQGYINLAESLIHRHSFAQNGRIETSRVPGYPFFVAIIKVIFGSYFAVTLVQIILAFAAALVIRGLGIMFYSKRVGEFAASLFILNPVTMTLSLLTLTDVPFLLLFIFGFYVAAMITEKNWKKRTIAAALLFVGAIYIRGMGLFALPIFIAPFFTVYTPWKLQLKKTAVLIAVIAIAVFPWIVRNYIQTGIASFNSFEAVNISWAVPKWLSATKGTSEAAETAVFQKSTGVPQNVWKEDAIGDLRYAKAINSTAEKLILVQPFSYAKWHITNSLPFLFPSSILFMRDAYDSATGYNRPFVSGSINALAAGDVKAFLRAATKDWWKLSERLLWLLGLLLAAYLATKEHKNPFVWVCIFITLYLMLLSGPAAGPRLSFQVFPLLFILFVQGAILLSQKFKRL